MTYYLLMSFFLCTFAAVLEIGMYFNTLNIISNMKKRFFFFLLMVMLCATNALATTLVKFSSDDFNGKGTPDTGSSVSLTKNGVTFVCDLAYGTRYSLRCYKNAEITISSSTELITSISFEFDEVNGKYYDGSLEHDYAVNDYKWESGMLDSQSRIVAVYVYLEECTAIENVDGVWYKFYEEKLEAYVTCEGASSASRTIEYQGEVIIPSSVTYNNKTYKVTCITRDAFQGCTNLTSVTIGSNVIGYDMDAFAGCTGLTSVTINSDALVNFNYNKDDGLKNLFGDQATSYIIGDDVTGIGRYAFRGCTALTSITIGKCVRNINSYAFDLCSNITSVVWNAVNCKGGDFGDQINSFVFGDEVEVIPASVCSGMKNLTSITIPNSVTSIGANAFSNGKRLQKVTFGENIDTIGDSAFANCPYLIEVHAKMEFPPVINSSVFVGCGDLSGVDCYIPEASMVFYRKADVWKKFHLIEEQADIFEAIDDIFNGQSPKTNKVIRNGNVLILRGDHTYTLQGQEVK